MKSDAFTRGGAVNMPCSTRQLRPSERAFVTALRKLGYGRFESLQIRRGELVLDGDSDEAEHVFRDDPERCSGLI